MKTRIINTAVLFGIFLLVSCQGIIETVNLGSELDTVSYCIGVNLGTNLKSSPIEKINYLAVAKGMKDIYEDKEVLIDPYEANRIISVYVQRLEAVRFRKNLEEGEKFLEKNKNKKGVVTLESGLQYRIITQGTGPKPKLTDEVTIHYHGTLIDGTVFDSSIDRGEPAKLPVSRVIKGWQEALQLMPVGSKWEIFIPPGLAYGTRPMPGGKIEPNMVLIFEVNLLSIEEPVIKK